MQSPVSLGLVCCPSRSWLVCTSSHIIVKQRTNNLSASTSMPSFLPVYISSIWLYHLKKNFPRYPQPSTFMSSQNLLIMSPTFTSCLLLSITLNKDTGTNLWCITDHKLYYQKTIFPPPFSAFYHQVNFKYNQPVHLDSRVSLPSE